MKKKILAGVAILLIAAAIYGYYQFTKKVETLENKVAEFSLSANELFDAFDRDEEAAIQQYVGKIVEVSGVVESIEESDTAANVVLVADNAMIGGVNCQMQQGVGVSDVQEGSEVTLKCECQGYLMNVVLNNCIKK